MRFRNSEDHVTSLCGTIVKIVAKDTYHILTPTALSKLGLPTNCYILTQAGSVFRRLFLAVAELDVRQQDILRVQWCHEGSVETWWQPG